MVKRFSGPREIILSKGVDFATDEQLISSVIGFGNKKYSHEKLANKIVFKLKLSVANGSTDFLNDLMKIYGVGKSKAIAIVSGIELGRRLYSDINEKKVIKNSQEAFLTVSNISRKKKEYLVAIYLNARFEKLSVRTIAIGASNTVFVQPKDIIAPALALNATAVLLAHNHPSGSLSPSQEDIAMTKKVKDCCDIMGLKLLDHIVVSGDYWESIIL